MMNVTLSAESSAGRCGVKFDGFAPPELRCFAYKWLTPAKRSAAAFSVERPSPGKYTGRVGRSNLSKCNSAICPPSLARSAAPGLVNGLEPAPPAVRPHNDSQEDEEDD